MLTVRVPIGLSLLSLTAVPSIAFAQLPSIPDPVRVQVINGDAFYASPSFWLSIGAIILSIVTLSRTIKNEKLARQRSIDDDYWLRKVLSPLILEPLLGYLGELTDSLAERAGDATRLSSFGSNDFTGPHSAIRRRLVYTKVLSSSLYAESVACLERVEDTVTLFCSGQSGTLAETISAIESAGLSILLAVRNHQVKS